MTRLALALPFLFAVACTTPQNKADKNAGDKSLTGNQSTTGPTADNGTKVAHTCNVDLDCGDKQLCLHSQCVDITADLAECRDARIYFAFNSDELTSNTTDSLARAARCLKADQGMRITVAGNADERGTEEYNLALGDRRARAVAHYLESLGVSSSQLGTVSYGEERPLCTEHDEACWQKNRRADFANRK